MSKLDEMIRELCPDGVEYKRFDEVCTLNARIGWQRLTKAEYMQLVSSGIAKPEEWFCYANMRTITMVIRMSRGNTIRAIRT